MQMSVLDPASHGTVVVMEVVPSGLVSTIFRTKVWGGVNSGGHGEKCGVFDGRYGNVH